MNTKRLEPYWIKKINFINLFINKQQIQIETD